MKQSFLLSAIGVSALFFSSGFIGATCGIREIKPGYSKCLAFARSNPTELQYSGLSEQLLSLQLGTLDLGTEVASDSWQLNGTTQLDSVLATLEDNFQAPFSTHNAELVEGATLPEVASPNEM
jgi:hypothetical protein